MIFDTAVHFLIVSAQPAKGVFPWVSTRSAVSKTDGQGGTGPHSSVDGFGAGEQFGGGVSSERFFGSRKPLGAILSSGI